MLAACISLQAALQVGFDLQRMISGLCTFHFQPGQTLVPNIFLQGGLRRLVPEFLRRNFGLRTFV